MSGSDVSARQHFLVKRGLLSDAVDGVFGPHTAQATRDYQARNGLAADGVVGVGTFSQAVREGYEAPAGRAAIPGMDTAADCSAFASCIASANIKFVVRYYSANAKKRMTRAEAVALANAGHQLAVVYQDSNDDLKFFSEQAGRKHASTAFEQAQAIGQPAGSAIYFAVDFDQSAEQTRDLRLLPCTVQRAIGGVNSLRGGRLRLRAYLPFDSRREPGDIHLALRVPGFSGIYEVPAGGASNSGTPSRHICGDKLAMDDDIAQNENFGRSKLHNRGRLIGTRRSWSEHARTCSRNDFRLSHFGVNVHQH
jgi:peptidoglycan hydrolase-like protein with peptidoglycan-binding domain